MRSRPSRAALAALLVVASVIAPAAPATAAPLAALPDTVRVNVAGLGTANAVISSTGTVTATAPNGRVLYQGGGRTVSRLGVRRLEGVELPRQAAPAGREERIDRLSLLREARQAAHEPDRTFVTIPFEFGVMRTSDGMVEPLLSGDRPLGVRFTTTDGLLQFNGRVYRGTLEIAIDDENDMIVVNTVGTKDYLASVVGAEMPSTWAAEAIGAQAIAARTYLSTHLRRHRAYDLEGDVRDQEYGGVGTEAASSTRAVERTAGIIATYRGAAIEALYSANAGGITEDSENVFANALPYLRSVPSPEDEIAKDSSWGAAGWQWTREVTAVQLRDRLRRRNVIVGDIRSVEVTRVSAAGRVLEARVTGTTGTRTVGKDQSRFYFDLLSQMYTVTVRPAETELVDHLNKARIDTLNALGAEVIGLAYRRVLGPEREMTELRTVGYHYRLPERFVFTGRGFGHGVGMSQWGAHGMALKGRTAEQILKHYYRGIELTRVGGA